MDTYLNLDKNYYHQNLQIKKQDYLQISLNATNANNLNKANQFISFTLNPSPSPLLLSEAYLNFQIKINVTQSDPPVATDKTKITLEHNFFPNLFVNAVLKLGTEEVETIHFTGETCGILGLVMFDNYNNNGDLFGFLPDNGKGDTTNTGFVKRKELYGTEYYGMYPLKNMFGFLQYYKRVIYNMQGEIRFTRNVDDKKIFYGEKDAKATLEIKELQLFIPELTLNPIPELSLLQRLDDGKPMDVNFLTRFTNINQLDKTKNHVTLKPNNIPFKPIYIFVAFQNEVESKFETNNSLFNQNKIKSLKIQVNNSFYPLNPIDISTSRNQLFYLDYIKACKYFRNKPQLSLLDFRNLYSIFCFDVSAQAENLCINGADITLHIVKENNYEGNCITIILAEKFMELKIKSGKMMTLELKTERKD